MAFAAKERRSLHRPQVRSGPAPTLPVVPARSPRILAVASAVDLDFRYGCTPAWWQLWKGLYEAGVGPRRHAVPRAAGRVAMVAHRAEPDLP